MEPERQDRSRNTEQERETREGSLFSCCGIVKFCDIENDIMY